MAGAADFHSHSSCSDGRLAPSDLVKLAKEKGLAALALTDHDTVRGLPEAMEAGIRLGVRVVAGVEISAEFEPGTMHLLGLGVDIANKDLGAALASLQQARQDRNPEVFRRLRALGLPLEYSAVEELAAGGQVGRPHFAQALVDLGVVGTFKEAFDRYLGKGKPAYVPKRRMASRDAIQVIHGAGGVCVLAHPIQTGLQGKELETLILILQAQGLDGIEAWHSDHTPEDVMAYLDLAARLGLRVSGGSDFHGIPGGRVELGVPSLSAELAKALLAPRTA